MSFQSWTADVELASLDPRQPQHTLVSEMSVAALSQNEEPVYSENLSSTGRRFWKKRSEDGEPIWPPLLESALLDGLKAYREVESEFKPVRDGRRAMRNCFLSDYIHSKTNRRRTTRQIGSRLQQLKETCSKDSIAKLIASSAPALHGQPSTAPEIAPANPYPRSPSFTTASPDIDHAHALSDRPWLRQRMGSVRTVPPESLYINIVLGKMLPSSTPPVVSFVAPNSPDEPTQIFLARPDIHQRDSTVLFHSPCPLLSQSRLSVFLDGYPSHVYSETTPLLCSSSSLNNNGWIYSCSLVSGFWHTLSTSANFWRYRIEQEIVPLCPLQALDACVRERDLETLSSALPAIITVHYQFFPPLFAGSIQNLVNTDESESLFKNDVHNSSLRSAPDTTAYQVVPYTPQSCADRKPFRYPTENVENIQKDSTQQVQNVSWPQQNFFSRAPPNTSYYMPHTFI